jgi:hypothetical protein
MPPKNKARFLLVKSSAQLMIAVQCQHGQGHGWRMSFEVAFARSIAGLALRQCQGQQEQSGRQLGGEGFLVDATPLNPRVI